MKTLLLFVALVFVPAVSGGQSNAAQPAEPDIVLPEVIMQIDDLSVENVEAKLPPEEELLAPERQLPPPTVGDIPVTDPAVPGAASVGEGTPPASTANLSAEAQLGGGLENTIVGKLSMKTLGADPRLSLGFSHEGADGFQGHQPGSGYRLRNDDLYGELADKLGPVDSHIQAGYRENEDGLQGRGSIPGCFRETSPETWTFP